MAVAVTRLELGARVLRREASRCRDGSAARRMLALALVLEGHSRGEAARCAGMERQTLRDWVHRYNWGSARRDLAVSGWSAPSKPGHFK